MDKKRCIELIRQYSIHISHSLGQNFLIDEFATDEIMTYILHDSAGLQLVNGIVEPYSMTTPDVTFYPGIYFVLIKTNNFNKVEKVIIR